MTERPINEWSIDEIQFDWLMANAQKQRIVVVSEPDGSFTVHQHTANSVFPSCAYPSAATAAARVLQLLGVSIPVTPQSWPERVEIGNVPTGPTQEQS
jgi:hypothetical protein